MGGRSMTDHIKQLSREQAIELAENKLYLYMPARALVEFQLSQDKLFMPFDVYHSTLEKILGRPVLTHEFIKPKALLNELNSK